MTGVSEVLGCLNLLLLILLISDAFFGFAAIPFPLGKWVICLV